MTDEELSVSDATLIARLRDISEGPSDYLQEIGNVAADRIEQLAATNEALVKERDEALWKAKCHEETLNAWFNRRELGHEAVDQAIVDAASGYLRTSRVGGMPQEESDLILGVMQDMARLGLFADLFARAALKGDDHEQI